MVTAITLPTFDPSVLINYYQAKLPIAASAVPASPIARVSETTHDSLPWEAQQSSQQAEDAKVLRSTNLIDLSNVPKNAGASPDSKTEQDNQKLFALYQAVNTLSYLAGMAKRGGMTTGQLAGLNRRFQSGLTQVMSFIHAETFNNFTLQAGQTVSSVTSLVSLAFPPFDYSGGTVANDAGLQKALPGVSASDSFDISVTKGGAATVVHIDFSQVQGALTVDNIVAYVNQQLAAMGFNSRFSRVMTQGTIDDPTNAKYGIALTPASGESLSLSSASASPALYLTGTTGSITGTADQQGRLVKLTDLDSGPQTVFNATTNPDTGITTAQSSVVDTNGNVYVVGNATGNFGNELNQGAQDAYLSKYDSAGNLQWTKLLGSTGTASGYSLALNPKGGVAVAGSTSAALTTDAIADGNRGSFVASYDSNGNQIWVTEIPTLNANQANAISVDASGKVYFGGQVAGVIGSGQMSSGKLDAYIAKLDAKGNITYEQQFGTSSNDQVAATAVESDGSLIVSSVQNGHAILAKYANGDAISAPIWTKDLGDLQNSGSIGGLVVSGNNIYLSGTTTNAGLTASGEASIAAASSGGMDAFVVSLTDNGTSVSANHVSYVGTSASDKGGGLTVGADGTVYLAGTTTGTFSGQSRTTSGTNNTFVAALSASGSINWTRQYGGADGQSTGAGIAIDPLGFSVLDKLGLPRGLINLNQSLDLTSQSTLRAGDSFEIQIHGTLPRTAKVTIEKGETLRSLADKINAALLNAGIAGITFKNGGEALQIKLNKGVNATFVAGPDDFDALARLGIPAGALSNAPGSSTTADSGHQVFGLGFGGTMDISTVTGAGAARAQLLNVLSSIRDTYRKTNTPQSSVATQITGHAPPYLAAQVANYSLALNLFAGSAAAGTSA